jgi:peptidoglycan/LPS O-acetylase OafA/YrhL
VTATSRPASAPGAADVTDVPRIAGLDGLRGLAILGVLVLHYEARQEAPWHALRYVWGLMVGSGWAGVDIFFVLSGFLITGILLDTKSHPRYFRLFYARRTLRIFPLYYAALILIFLILPQFGIAHAVPASTQVWYWAYLSNVLIAFRGWGVAPGYTPHFWSLAIEEQFYLVWPAVIYLASQATVRRICLAVIVLSLTSRLALTLHHASPTMVELLTTSRIEPIAVGAWVAVMLRGGASGIWLRSAKRRIAIASAVLFAVVVVVGRSVRPDDPLMATLGYSAVAWLGAAAILHATDPRPDRAPGGVLMLAPLRFLGRYSYGLYVWHYPIMIFLTLHHFTVDDLTRPLGARGLASAVYVVVNFTAAVLVSLVSWHVLERPLLNLKRYFDYRTREPRLLHAVTVRTSPGTSDTRA